MFEHRQDICVPYCTPLELASIAKTFFGVHTCRRWSQSADAAGDVDVAEADDTPNQISKYIFPLPALANLTVPATRGAVARSGSAPMPPPLPLRVEGRQKGNHALKLTLSNGDASVRVMLPVHGRCGAEHLRPTCYL